MELVYDPSIFTKVTSLDAAKRIILTPELNLTTEDRWIRETPHICDLISGRMSLGESSIVVDYGCGVGRIAKELIKRHKCYVIGIDIAANMRALAASYVNSDRFFACSPSMFDKLIVCGIEVDLILAVWVLQHCQDVNVDLDLIDDAMGFHGQLIVVNEGTGRFVPTDHGWANDGIDVRAVLSERFQLTGDGKLSPDVVGENQSERTFWAAYESKLAKKVA